MREAYVRWGSAGQVLGIGGLTAPEVGSGCVDDSLRTGAGSVGRGEVMGFGGPPGHVHSVAGSLRPIGRATGLADLGDVDISGLIVAMSRVVSR
jgi:hypothetical protein